MVYNSLPIARPSNVSPCNMGEPRKARWYPFNLNYVELELDGWLSRE